MAKRAGIFLTHKFSASACAYSLPFSSAEYLKNRQDYYRKLLTCTVVGERSYHHVISAFITIIERSLINAVNYALIHSLTHPNRACNEIEKLLKLTERQLERNEKISLAAVNDDLSDLSDEDDGGNPR